MQRIRQIFTLLILGTLALGLQACGSGDSSGSGTVRLGLTDATDHPYSEVVIAIKEVRVVPAGEEDSAGGGLPLVVAYDPPRTVDVLDLAFQQELLGEAVVPAGSYHQLRLVLAANTDPGAPANYVVLADDPQQTPLPLDTPSGQQSGLKVVGDFEVAAGEVTAVVLDFDPGRAVVEAGQSGKRLLKPTGIRVVQVDDVLPTYGALIGTVVRDGADGEETLAGARVAAVPENGPAPIAAGTVNPEDGSFRLFLPPGAYELQAAADGFEPYSSLPTLFEVVQGEDTDAGVIVLASPTAD